MKTIRLVKTGNSLLGTQKIYRVVHRQTWSGFAFTVAINNSIQGNYQNELEAIAHFDRLTKELAVQS